MSARSRRSPSHRMASPLRRSQSGARRRCGHKCKTQSKAQLPMLMAANVENRDTGTSAALQIQPTRRDWLYVFHRRASSEDASASRSGRPELLPNLMEFVCLALHFNVVEKRAEPYSDASTELLGPQSPAPGARIVPMGECASEPRGGHLGG